jgi:hypothetical protein
MRPSKKSSATGATLVGVRSRSSGVEEPALRRFRPGRRSSAASLSAHATSDSSASAGEMEAAPVEAVAPCSARAPVRRATGPEVGPCGPADPNHGWEDPDAMKSGASSRVPLRKAALAASSYATASPGSIRPVTRLSSRTSWYRMDVPGRFNCAARRAGAQRRTTVVGTSAPLAVCCLRLLCPCYEIPPKIPRSSAAYTH